ncbi:MAG: ABC transporter ATP-binding protein, partial [Deltaproteobacteria bacterium]
AHLAQRRLDQLSGGELQRVMIARAICQEPKIILLDEPTTALDPAHQVRIMDLMERFRQEKATTVIMVSHDLNLAAMYADRLLLLKDGKIVVIGSPGEVITPEGVKESYGCELLIDKNPLGGVPRVVPIPEKYRKTIRLEGYLGQCRSRKNIGKLKNRASLKGIHKFSALFKASGLMQPQTDKHSSFPRRLESGKKEYRADIFKLPSTHE